jgi:hypothetical protein
MNESGLMKTPNHKETKSSLGCGRSSHSISIITAPNMTITIVRYIIIADAERLFELRPVRITLSCSAATGTAVGKIIPKVSRRNKLPQCRKPSEQRLEYRRHSFAGICCCTTVRPRPSFPKIRTVSIASSRTNASGLEKPSCMFRELW